MQVDDDRGDTRPVLHRGLRARRGSGLAAVPAIALPLDQLMLGHLGSRRLQVEHLAAFRPGHRPPGQPGAALAAAARLVADLPVRPGRLPALSPYARPARRACGRSACAAAAVSVRAWPVPRSTAAGRSSAGSASARPQAQRSARGPAPVPPGPAPARPPLRPARRAAIQPARPAPHTTAALLHRAHPGPYAPRTFTARSSRHLPSARPRKPGTARQTRQPRGVAGHHHRCERRPEAGRDLRRGSAATFPDGLARAPAAGYARISRQRSTGRAGTLAPAGGPVGLAGDAAEPPASQPPDGRGHATRRSRGPGGMAMGRAGQRRRSTGLERENHREPAGPRPASAWMSSCGTSHWSRLRSAAASDWEPTT